MSVRSSELLQKLRERGLSFNSVMTVMDDETAEKARRVARGDAAVAAEVKRASRAALPDEVALPPPVVPAPAQPVRPIQDRQQPRRTTPGGRPPPPQRRGIKIFRQKDTRERRNVDRQRGEEILSGRTIPITVPIALKDFSQEIGVKTNVLLIHLMKQGVMANPNTSLDEETVMVLGEAFNRTIEVQAEKSVEDELEQVLQVGDEAATDDQA
ncbi:MAG: translation initiation factor IF-2 N-terminal domain-containing protein, partial [Planctomycetota bacterium]